MNIKIPTQIEYVLNTLYKNGYEGYVVGGAVRDAVLNREALDFDVTTNALPKDIHRIFKNCIDTGLKHGTVTVIYDKIPIEITTYRTEGKYNDHRRPESVEFSASLSDDLKRRDFTMNALCYNGEIVDLFGGLDDIKNKTIKAVGDAVQRFDEDALRMMRAVRFACTLGFKLDNSVKKAIKDLSHLIDYVSCERIKAEFDKLIISDYIENLNEIKNCNFFSFILPHLQNAIDLNFDFKVLTKAKKDTSIRYVLLFTSINLENPKQFLNKYKFSNTEKKEIMMLFEYSKKIINDDSITIKNILSKTGNKLFEKIIYVKKALGENTDKIENTYLCVKDDPYLIKHLCLNGNDIKALGIYGYRIKEALSYLINKVIENKELNTKERLLNELENFLKN